jgi:hypothetical protein
MPVKFTNKQTNNQSKKQTNHKKEKQTKEKKKRGTHVYRSSRFTDSVNCCLVDVWVDDLALTLDVVAIRSLVGRLDVIVPASKKEVKRK